MQYLSCQKAVWRAGTFITAQVTCGFRAPHNEVLRFSVQGSHLLSISLDLGLDLGLGQNKFVRLGNLQHIGLAAVRDL